MPQIGENLGYRMQNAFLNNFNIGFKKVIIIGTDTPDLSLEFLKTALDSLNSHDAVVGPSGDGGYYLIGFKNNTFLPQIFNNIKWSTNTVFDSTMKIFSAYSYNVNILPEWQDIDTITDLKLFFSRNLNSDFKNSESMKFLLNPKNNLNF
jgi:rSAM/selenodomain-associated transferase 1